MKQPWHIYLIGSLLLTSGLFYIIWQADISAVLHKISNQFLSQPIEDYSQFDIELYKDILYFYLASMSIIAGVFIIIWAKKYQLLVKTCKTITLHFIQFYKNLSPVLKKAVYFLILLNIVIKAYLVRHQPIFTDEAWTYLMFTQKGFLTSLSYYPAPNNHILYSLISNASILLQLKPLPALRLPNFLINIWVILTFIVVFGKLFSPKTAVFLVYIFSSGFSMIYYGYVARGYMLYLWGFLILFYVSIKLLNHSELTPRYACLWLLGSITGFWAIPAFLYPYLSLALFISWYFFKQKSYQNLIKFLKLNSLLALIIIILYTPVFIVSGYKALTANRYVSGMTRWSVLHHFYNHFNDTSWLLFNLPLLFSLLIAIILFIYFYRKHWQISIAFAFYLIMLSPVIMLVHSTVPAPRIWIYWLIPVFYLLGYLFEYNFKQNFTLKQWVLFTTIIVLIQSVVFFIRIKTYDIESYEAQKITDYLWQQQAENLYSGKDTYLGASIFFNYLNRNKKINYKQDFNDWNMTNFNKYDWFLFRYPPTPEECQKLGLKPVNLIRRKQSCHHLYHKIKR